MEHTNVAKVSDLIHEQSKTIETLRQEVMKIMVGQEHLINRMMIALITDGHILIEGVPGLAKTTAIKTMAQALGL